MLAELGNTQTSAAGLAWAQAAQGADHEKQVDAAVYANAVPGGKAKGDEAIDGGKETT